MCSTGAVQVFKHYTYDVRHYSAAMQCVLYLAKVHRAVLSTGLPFPVWTR